MDSHLTTLSFSLYLSLSIYLSPSISLYLYLPLSIFLSIYRIVSFSDLTFVSSILFSSILLRSYIVLDSSYFPLFRGPEFLQVLVSLVSTRLSMLGFSRAARVTRKPPVSELYPLLLEVLSADGFLHSWTPLGTLFLKSMPLFLLLAI